VVAHACHPNYSGNGGRRIKVQSQPQKKLVRPYLHNKLGLVGHSCDPSTWDVKIGGLQSEAILYKSVRYSLKNKLKAKGLGILFKW
jgi:hypothetical protein